MKELKKDLESALEVVKDYNKFKHLFSNDEAERTLANLNVTLRRIQSYLEISKAKEIVPPKNKVIEEGMSAKSGSLVKVRPCDEKYANKTFVGFYIGDVATGSHINLVDKKKVQLNFSSHNPAIFVPELGEIIYGYESWWSEISSIEDLKSITDEDIENVWYVKLLKKLS